MVSRKPLPTPVYRPVPQNAMGVGFPVAKQMSQDESGDYRINDLNLGPTLDVAETLFVSYSLSTGDYPLPGSVVSVPGCGDRTILSTTIGRAGDLVSRYHLLFGGEEHLLPIWWEDAYHVPWDDAAFICLLEFVENSF